MLSLPEDWDYTLTGLAKINQEGKDAIRAAVVELERAGYIYRCQTVDKTGKFSKMCIRDSSLALARNHKQLSGKVNLGKMLRETRDLRQFPMTPEQYRQFEKLAKKRKLLFSTIRDRDERGKLVDVILPVTELDRANQIFERLLSQVSSQEKDVSDLQKAQQERQDVPVPEHQKNPPKKDFRSERDSPDTRPRSSTPSESVDMRTTHDRPSVEERLKGYREKMRKQSVPALSLIPI